MRHVVLAIASSIALSMLGWTGEARAWELFRSENPDVAEGNELVAAGNPQAAIEAYDRAARALPSEPAVHLDRGIALLEAGQFDAAREALRIATEPPASPEIRGSAFYDLGLAFYRQGDAAAQAENHEEAQRLFREAADAFRSSLRQQPGNRDAGWNLELALRRIQEQQEQQEQEQQDQQDQQQQDQQDQQQDQQDQQQQDQQDQQQDQQDQQQDQQDQQQDQQQQDQQDQPGEEPSEGEQQSEDGEPSEQQPQDSRDPQQQEGAEGTTPDESEQEGQDAQSTGSDDRALPPDMSRVLDALEDGEESLERARARARGSRDSRRVLQDW